MESASSVPGVPLPKNIRPKQREVIERFATASRVVAKLPTGYGKTLAGAGSYAQLRHRGECNRLLWLVPRRSQADQAAESVPDELTKFGVSTRSIIVSADEIPALKAHTNSTCEVFVATIQSLVTGQGFNVCKGLMRTGRWFVVVDEHHHYSENGIWADRVKQLNYCAMLAMSATPNRHDGTDYFADPDIAESYVNAANAKPAPYVKRLSLHAYEYEIDAVTVNGEVKFTTDELIAQVGSDCPEAIDKFMALRKMRWSPKYISPLVTFPLDRIVSLRTRGVKAQMLIQAMSCSHAEMVCKQVQTLLPEFMTVDWVGTGPSGRPDPENDRVLKAFCPRKDKITGRRNWSLDVLVNVGMAGEGLDTTDVTEVVFLTPGNLTTSNFQIIGRGSRVMVVPDNERMPRCNINVDTSAPMAEYVGPRIMSLFDDDVVANVDDKEPGDGEHDPDWTYEPLPEEIPVIIVDVHLMDIRSEPMFDAVVDRLKRRHPDVDDEQLKRHAEQAIQDYLNRGNSESAVLAEKREGVETATVKITGLIMSRRRTATGKRVDGTIAKEIKWRINTKKKSLFGPVNEATSDELQRHWSWLRDLESTILAAPGLQGVPAWLQLP